MARKYLLHFAQEHISFRWPEFLALTSKNSCTFDLISCEEHLFSRPYILIELGDTSDEEKLIKSARESYLLKDIYELWAMSKKSVEDLALEASRSKQYERSRILHATQPDQSFCIRCESFGSKLTQPMKVDMISKMPFLESFKPSKLNLNNPVHTYCIFQMTDTISDLHGQTAFREYYFGRHLAQSGRSLIEKFSLRKRCFIANTSMDPLLSMVAANAAKVKSDDLVFDPFVGSGSLLVAAAHMGAYILGTDIDWKLLHGKSKPSRKGVTKRDEGEGVRANLRQYDLEDRYIDVFISDTSRHPFKKGFELDGIIADPPYGIRESSERIGARQHHRMLVTEEKRLRYPSKTNYNTADLICDLLSFSVTQLKKGGRLVFFLPVTLDFEGYKFEDFLPGHPCLELVAFCDQQLTRKTYRLMVILERNNVEYDEFNHKVMIPAALSNMDFRGTYFSENK